MEIWNDITGYEGLYQVSNYGNIKSLVKWDINKRRFIKKECYLKLTDNGNGYLIVCLRKNKKKKSFYVHRLVASHFVENPFNKNVVNHKDYNTHNNNFNNLEWVTQKENVNYSVEKMKHRKSITHSNTNEKYISFRANKNKFRVIIDKKEYGSFNTLQEAIEKRNNIMGVIE